MLILRRNEVETLELRERPAARVELDRQRYKLEHDRGSKEAVNNWLRRNRDSIGIRRFLHPTRYRPVPFIREADAARYRAIVAEGSAKHIGYCFRVNKEKG